MSKLFIFLRSFQASPVFANLAIHAWLAAFLVFAAGVKYPTHRMLICLIGVALAALKEFWFDHRYQLPPQPYHNAAQDFAGYLIGGALAILAWMAV